MSTITIITSEGKPFEVDSKSEYMKDRYLSLIDISKPCAFSEELLNIIFNDIIPDDIDKLIYYLDMLICCCYDKVAKKCYDKMFNMVDVLPKRAMENISIFDFTKDLNTIRPHIAIQIINSTIYTIDYEELLLQICCTDNADLLNLIRDKLVVKDYHIMLAIKMNSVKVLSNFWYLDYNKLDMTNKDMFDLYYKNKGSTHYIDTIMLDHVHHMEEPYMKELCNGMILIFATIYNSHKIIDYLLAKDIGNDIATGVIIFNALENANDKVIEHFTGINIKNYKDMNDFISDLDAVIPNVKNCYALSHYACKTGNLELFNLCTSRIDALRFAIKYGQLDITIHLLNGSSISIYQVLDKLHLIKGLLDAHIHIDDMHDVEIKTGSSVEIIEYLNSKGVTMDFSNYDGSNLEVVKYLGNKLDLDKLFLKACDNFSNLPLAKYLRNICNMEDVNDYVRVVNLLF